MATIRFYSNEKRLSTGRVLKDGALFQVYPEKKEFASEDGWRAHWIAVVGDSILVKKNDGTTIKPILICGELTANSNLPTPGKAPEVLATHAPKKAKAKPNHFGLSKYGLEDFHDAHFFSAPSGDYYVGDLCYALKDELYEKVFGGMAYSPGLYKFKDGTFFMLSHTSCGDGEYHGTNGKTYLVDAGIIGIASMSLCKPIEEWSAGEVHRFPHGVNCAFAQGRFEFTSKTNSFTIQT